MSVVFTAGVKLEVKECPVCFVTYGVPEALAEKKRADGGNWYCPNGHSLIYTESTVQKLEREKKQLADKLARQVSITDQYSASLDNAHKAHTHTRNRLRGTQAVVTRYKKKIVAGRCVCCSQQFKDLERHMKNRHPDWNPDKHADAMAAKEPVSQ